MSTIKPPKIPIELLEGPLHLTSDSYRIVDAKNSVLKVITMWRELLDKDTYLLLLSIFSVESDFINLLTYNVVEAERLLTHFDMNRGFTMIPPKLHRYFIDCELSCIYLKFLAMQKSYLEYCTTILQNATKHLNKVDFSDKETKKALYEIVDSLNFEVKPIVEFVDESMKGFLIQKLFEVVNCMVNNQLLDSFHPKIEKNTKTISQKQKVIISEIEKQINEINL